MQNRVVKNTILQLTYDTYNGVFKTFSMYIEMKNEKFHLIENLNY